MLNRSLHTSSLTVSVLCQRRVHHSTSGLPSREGHFKSCCLCHCCDCWDCTQDGSSGTPPNQDVARTPQTHLSRPLRRASSSGGLPTGQVRGNCAALLALQGHIRKALLAEVALTQIFDEHAADTNHAPDFGTNQGVRRLLIVLPSLGKACIGTETCTIALPTLVFVGASSIGGKDANGVAASAELAMSGRCRC